MNSRSSCEQLQALPFLPRPLTGSTDTPVPPIASVETAVSAQLGKPRTDDAAVRNKLAGLMLWGVVANTGCMLGGGATQLAPPPAPPPVLPPGLDPLPLAPAAGLTRVVLDANGARATVTEVLGWDDSLATGVGVSVWVSGHSERSRPICITPCEFDFDPGLHVLRFEAGRPSHSETVRVQVGSQRKLVRVALGYDIPSPDRGVIGVVLQGLGASAAIIGAALWAASAAGSSEREKQMESPAIAMTLGGGAAFLLGIPLAYRRPGTHQPSSVTEATLPTSKAP